MQPAGHTRIYTTLTDATGLPGRKIKTAELQELTVMAEAA